MATNFGDESEGDTDYIIENQVVGINATTGAEGGTADSITVYLNVPSGTHKVKCALYSSDRETLLGQTEEIDLGSGQDWRTFNFASGPALEATTEYYIVVWGEVKSYIVTEWEDAEAGTTQTYDNHAYGGTFPADISGDTTWANTSLGIYCTYSATPPPPPSPFTAVNIGDTWKTVSGSNVIKVNVGDAWKNVTAVKKQVGDAWKAVTIA